MNDDHLIGEEGTGFKRVLFGMNAERILLAGEALGTGETISRNEPSDDDIHSNFVFIVNSQATQLSAKRSSMLLIESSLATRLGNTRECSIHWPWLGPISRLLDI